MKKYIFVVSLLCLLAACTGKRQGEAAVEIAALPAVEDVVMLLRSHSRRWNVA